MIIDKTVHEWLLKGMYDKTHITHYGQYPVGIRFHLGIIDNHKKMKEAYESDNEFYINELITDTVDMKTSTKNLRERMETGSNCYNNNESFELENCAPTLMKTLKNDHWEYLHTDTFWGERIRTVFAFNIHKYFPEKQCSYVCCWNWVYQEFVLVNRTKTKRPSSTINSDDTVINLKIPYDGFERDVFVVTSTEDKYRNHTESLKDAKIFVEPDWNQLKILYK